MSHPAIDRLRGLYAVTPDWQDTARLTRAVAAAVAGGAALVQYRNKTASADLRREQALALRAVCRQAAVPLIINDDLDLAVQIDADGVHLGRDDGDCVPVRSRIGPDRLLGISCYGDLARVRAARAAGAEIVGIGAVFASATKPHAPPVLHDVLAKARECGVRVAAIGGITLANAPGLIASGADLLAVVSDLFDNPDITSRAAAYAALFA